LPSSILIRIRIPNTDPEPDPLTTLNPDPIRIRIRGGGGGSETLFPMDLFDFLCPILCANIFTIKRAKYLRNPLSNPKKGSGQKVTKVGILSVLHTYWDFLFTISLAKK
jgi:hypothetical protein